ncbi:hypothetical protein H072_5978 [Dactylellina haptotyla CBS 200.50]|uniref:Importin N-terminal domain-containing protein n=1 Tax=Dactylellina haptotyla (strain CBS 200.50) TaxID=1284197 RepID=S8AB63_DACHA|nr:hypothetical protein H072_5978 [Dactylellina haptotyla CBS 200.50]
MEQKVHYLLTALQSAEEGPRRAAEGELFQLYSDDSFPIALANIAAATDLDFTGRQASIVYLRTFIDECWSPPYDKYAGPPIKEEVKVQLRNLLLQLLSDKERKIRAAAAFAVSRIASYDFPEDWPSLLQDILNAIPTATDEQLHGLLKVLTDLVEDGFSEDQFFPVAHQLVEVLYHVATSEARPSTIRSLAVQAVRSCIELLEMVKDGHPGPVEQFAIKVVDVWMAFFIQVLEKPYLQLADGTSEEYNGLVTLKLQTYKTISKIVSVFPNTMSKYMTKLFQATWSELSTSKDRYVKDFVEGDADGRLTNVDGLPFTLDLLMLEEADFLQTCLRSKSVKEEFLQAINTSTQPLEQMVYTCVLLAQITGEDEGLWELDFNVFVAEETAMTANYTARTAASDLIMRLWDWLQAPVLTALLTFAAQEQSSWKTAEAAFYLLEQAIASESDNADPVFAQLNPSIISGLLSNIQKSLTHENVFLRARGWLLGSNLTCLQSPMLADFLNKLVPGCIQATSNDSSDIVKISAIRAVENIAENTNKEQILHFQVEIVRSIAAFLSTQSPEDREEAQDVLSVLANTLKSTLRVEPRLALDPSANVFELMFTLGESGAGNVYLSNQIQEIVEDTAEALPDDFINLCNQTIPLIIKVLDNDTYEEENSFSNLSVELLSVILRNASGPLPSGMVDTLMPRLVRCLLTSHETALLQSGAEALKCIVENDIQQLLGWHDGNGKSGLELTLVVIDRLLGPDLPDQAALEIGGLAAEVVDKASQQLGPLLPVLLKGVAARLATASATNLIQSLIVVFARLVIKQPNDVVDFLANNPIGDRSGLQVVLSAWLENSNVFSGYSEIKQNVAALANLYALNDPRVAAVQVQGDQMAEQTTRIMTRAQRKHNPIRYTSVSAPLKIIKLLVLELGSGSASASTWKVDMAGKGAVEEPIAEEDEEWEDDEDVLDLGSHAVKQALLGLGEDGTERSASAMRRGGDDDTQAFIINFFRESSSTNLGGFNELYAQLSDDEKQILSRFIG